MRDLHLDRAKLSAPLLANVDYDCKYGNYFTSSRTVQDGHLRSIDILGHWNLRTAASQSSRGDFLFLSRRRQRYSHTVMFNHAHKNPRAIHTG